jgi:hypothetical protein
METALLDDDVLASPVKLSNDIDETPLQIKLSDDIEETTLQPENKRHKKNDVVQELTDEIEDDKNKQKELERNIKYKEGELTLRSYIHNLLR